MSYLSYLPIELKREIDILYRSWQLIIKPSDNIYDVFIVSSMGIYYQELYPPIDYNDKDILLDQISRFRKDCENNIECELDCGHSFTLHYLPLPVSNEIPCSQSVYFLTLDSTNYHSNTVGLYIPKDYTYIINQLIEFYISHIDE